MNLSNLKQIPLGALLCLSISAQAQTILPADGVETGATASYTGVVAPPDSDVGGNPGSVISSAAAGPGGTTFNIPVLGDLTDESVGHARSLLPGSVGSYSSAGGYSPGFGGAVGGPTVATSFARSVTHWQAFNSNPNASTVDIDVLSFFDGVMATVDYAGAPMNASVRAELNVITSSGVVNVFAADARLSDPGGLVASSVWASSFAVEFASPNINVVSVRYSEFFEDAFTVNVGETFAWEVLLSTEAFVEGPYEIHAVADFLNTGSGGLSVNTPGASLVQISAVPEPSVWASMMLGMLLLIGRLRIRARES